VANGTSRFSYNYITEDEVTYVCVATMDLPTRLCFGFLTKIKNLYDGGEEFDAVLEEQMVLTPSPSLSASLP
jgi:hypothetical protein